MCKNNDFVCFLRYRVNLSTIFAVFFYELQVYNSKKCITDGEGGFMCMCFSTTL